MTQTVLLGDIAEINMGQSPKSEFYNIDGDGLPFMQGVRTFGRMYPTIDTWCTKPTKTADKGDVLFSVRAPVGDLNYAPDYMCIGRGLASLKSRNNKFLFYLLQANKERLISSQTGSVFGSVSATILKNFKLTIPESVDEQDRIANILGSFDEKIELNRQMNETLEQMVQTLFRHYFVDNPEAEEWKIGQLDDLFEVTMGQSPPGSSYNELDEGITFYQGRAEFGVRFPNKRLSTVDPKRLAKRGDTLLSVRAPVGDINQATEECCIGRGLAAISSKVGQTSFCYYSCKNLQARFAEYNSEGTVFGAINGKQLKSLKIKIPTNDIIEKFECHASNFDEQILNNSQQIQTLTTLRDTLLPRLISEKVRV